MKLKLTRDWDGCGGGVGGRVCVLSSIVDCFVKKEFNSSVLSLSVDASTPFSIKVGIVVETFFDLNCFASLNHVFAGVLISLTFSMILLS